MTLDYFYGQTGELFSFYRIPKALFQEQRFQSLSTDAKTLYGILLDRMSLSAKNGWLDEQGRVFIIFTIEDAENEKHILPADPDVKNFSYTVVDGEVFYRENSVMTQVDLSDTAKGRVTGMVELRQIVNELIQQQLEDYPDEDIKATQERLNAAYDAFTAKYGLLNDRKNGRLFEQDSSYYLLCSLENLDEQGQLKSKAAMFTKRTIRPERTVTSVDTPSEALAVSIGEHAIESLKSITTMN